MLESHPIPSLSSLSTEPSAIVEVCSFDVDLDRFEESPLGFSMKTRTGELGGGTSGSDPCGLQDGPQERRGTGARLRAVIADSDPI